MLEIINFSKKYENGKLAVDNLSLKVNAKDIFAFIGHNGAGKTTTIKSIVGILPINSGDILVDNISVKDNAFDAKKRMAYVPDNPDLYENLKAISYLNFVCDVYQVPASVRKVEIEKWAKKFEIYDELNNYIASYSHGMKQKLALIAAFIHSPKVLILDEPFVGLDPKASYLVKQAMIEFCENGGAIFFSTHILEVAEKLCNKVAIIKDGKLIASGSMEEITKNHDLEAVFLELTDHE